MKNVKVVALNDDVIVFENDIKLYSRHDQDCCESHWLAIGDLTKADFDGLEFDITTDAFFSRIEGYGIELIPVNGMPVRIAGHGSNNGYYSSDLTLVLAGTGFERSFDITECQEYTPN